MTLRKQAFITLCFFIFLSQLTFAQDKYKALEDTLRKMGTEIPALDEKVTISVTNVSLQEFLRGVAKNSGLNIDVSPDLNFMVINNFSGVRVRDILVFICRQYDLDLNIIGNIVTIYKEHKPEVFTPEKLSIRYDSLNGLLTIDYRDENLGTVAKEITRLTGKNVILASGLSDKKVTGYIQNMPFENALDKFMFANSLKQTRTEDGFYLIEEVRQVQPEVQQPDQRNNPRSRRDRRQQSNNGNGEYELSVVPLGPDSLSVIAVNAPMAEIINELSNQTHKNYFMTAPVEDVATLKVEGSGFEEILENMLSGTKYTYRKSGDIYIIGEKQVRPVALA